MRLLYNNLFDDYDILDYSSQNSNYPASNVQDTILSNTWQTDVGDVSDQYITIDLGAATDITCAVISNHNLTSGATVKVEFNSSDAWGAPAVTETLTWRSTHIIKFFTAHNYRYVRFYFDDDANTDLYLEAGRLFLGTYLQMTPSSNLPFKLGDARNDRVIVTDQGSCYGTPGVSRSVYQYEFSGVQDTMIDSMRLVRDEVGNYKPVYCVNYDSVYTRHDVLYGRIASSFDEEILGGKKNNYSLVIEECK